jgi:hypothetical protein
VKRWTRLSRPLSECRLSLIACSVCLSPGSGADSAVVTGTPVWRSVPADADTSALMRRAASADDASAANLDRNLAMGLDRLREAQAAGAIGELAPRALALCGPMAATRRAVDAAAKQAVRLVRDDGVDAALLVPT